MKSVLIILGAILILGLIIFLGNKYWSSTSGVKGLATYSADNPEAPKIEISEKTYDFGKIQLADVVKHDFKIKNIGKNDLVISALWTSCHCTTVIMKIPGKPDSPSFDMHSMGSWQGEIVSGIEAVLEVTYEPAKHPAKGPVSRVIYLKTNDPNNPDPKLEITAEVL